MLRLAALNGVLSGLNHLLREATWARQRLAPHVGRKVRVLLPLASPSWKFDFSIDETGLMTAASFAEADVDIELPADAPLRALRGQDELLREVHVRGSAELAEALNFVLPRLRWDIEEDLSKLVGDVAAHRLGQGMRDFSAWQRQAAGNLAKNLAEYLTEEQPMLVKPADTAGFAADVGRLCDDLARLEKRLDQRASSYSPPPKAL